MNSSIRELDSWKNTHRNFWARWPPFKRKATLLSLEEQHLFSISDPFFNWFWSDLKQIYTDVIHLKEQRITLRVYHNLMIKLFFVYVVKNILFLLSQVFLCMWSMHHFFRVLVSVLCGWSLLLPWVTIASVLMNPGDLNSLCRVDVGNTAYLF